MTQITANSAADPFDAYLRRQVPEAKKKAQGLVDYFDRIETILNGVVLAEAAE